MAILSYACYMLVPTNGNDFCLEDAQEFIRYLAARCYIFSLILKGSSQGLSLLLKADFIDHKELQIKLYELCPSLKIVSLKPATQLIKNPSLVNHYALKRHYAYPLYVDGPAINEARDPLFKLLGHLGEGQSVEVELKARACSPLKVKVLRRRILKGRAISFIDNIFLRVLLNFLYGLLTLIQLIIRAAILAIKGNKALAQEVKVVEPGRVRLLDKLYQPLFKTTLMVKIKASNLKHAYELASQIDDALKQLAKAMGPQRLASYPKPTLSLFALSDLAAIYNLPKKMINLL